MRIAITGSTGLIGSALIPSLEADGHEITRIVRPGSKQTGVQWDPVAGTIDHAGLEGHDAFVHLAGESVAALWTTGRKRRLRESRVRGTALLSSTIASLDVRPSVLVSASAIGFYGNRPGEIIDEASPRGEGFLAHLAEEWEAATEPARRTAIRVVNPRMGLVLSPKGGALGPMLPLFKAGLGGRLGDGRQIWSWVAIDDVVGALKLMITTQRLEGPVNVVAPLAVTNLAFTRALGRVLRRPTIMAAPEIVLKTVGGDMAQEMLLNGVRVVPRKLQGAGYEFVYPELEAALRALLR